MRSTYGTLLPTLLVRLVASLFGRFVRDSFQSERKGGRRCDLRNGVCCMYQTIGLGRGSRRGRRIECMLSRLNDT
eukprot:scaffold933_cov148-Prasinococcus_capsulatus_cf.AAC.1